MLMPRGLCLLLIIGVMGCGSSAKAPKHPDRTQVKGTVTYKGTPVEGANVTLHPVQKGYGAFGTTDALGEFVLGTFDPKDGVVPGEYKVSITKLESGAATSTPAPGEPGYDPNPKEETPKSVLPEKYADFTKSGLTATIGSTPVDALNFALE